MSGDLTIAPTRDSDTIPLGSEKAPVNKAESRRAPPRRKPAPRDLAALKSVRLICLATLVFYPLFWLLTTRLLSGRVNPLWANLLVMAVAAAGLGISYMREQLVQYARGFVSGLLLLITAHTLLQLKNNALDPAFVITFLGVLAISISTMAFLFVTRLWMIAYAVFVAVGGVSVAFMVSAPQINPIFFALLVLLADGAGFVMGQAQLAFLIKVRTSEERFALATRGANDGIWDWNLHDGTIYFSRRWIEMLGHDESEVGNKPDEWFKRIDERDQSMFKVRLDAYLKGDDELFECEYRMRLNDGGFLWVLTRGAAVRDMSGDAVRFAGSMSDIHQRKLIEGQLSHESTHDGLTGLPNRDLFIQRVDRCIARCSRDSETLYAVLVLDLDDFKLINDSLGHSSGDRVLVELATRMRVAIRKGDTVCRLGGDEFAVLLEDLRDVADAIRAAKRFQQEIIKPIVVNGRNVFTSASVGIAVRSPSTRNPSEFLRDSDTAMHHAKSAGKGLVQMFDKEMHTNVVSRLELESGIRDGLVKDQFQAMFQPIVKLSNEQLAGFEALARWKRPGQDDLVPHEFLPVAEKTGMVVAIDRIVMRRAVEQMQVWNRQLDLSPDRLSIHVNLSNKQLTESDFVMTLEECLKSCRLPGTAIRLEINESALSVDLKPVQQTLLRCRELGAGVLMDNFGTGYSVGYLRQLSVSHLKLSAALVQQLPGNRDAEVIIRGIVGLARHFQVAVFAQGVETKAQTEMLRKLDCDYAQGYYFSRPLQVEEATRYLTDKLSTGKKIAGSKS